MKLSKVKSSAISHVGYDSDSREMTVRFKESGKDYVLPDVSPIQHARLMQAKSIGKHFHKHFKGKF